MPLKHPIRPTAEKIAPDVGHGVWDRFDEALVDKFLDAVGPDAYGTVASKSYVTIYVPHQSQPVAWVNPGFIHFRASELARLTPELAALTRPAGENKILPDERADWKAITLQSRHKARGESTAGPAEPEPACPRCQMVHSYPDCP